jgi:hypothetical protein
LTAARVLNEHLLHTEQENQQEGTTTAARTRTRTREGVDGSVDRPRNGIGFEAERRRARG